MKYHFYLVISLFILVSCSTTKDSVTDWRDGQVYHLDEYADQTWIREDIIYKVQANAGTDEMPPGLYTLSQAKTACPDGFHLPSLAEWQKRILTYPGSHNPRKGIFHKSEKDSSLYYRGIVWGSFTAEGVMAVYWTTTDSTRVFDDESGIPEPAIMGIHVYDDEEATDSVRVESAFLNSPEHGFSCKCIQDKK